MTTLSNTRYVVSLDARELTFIINAIRWTKLKKLDVDNYPHLSEFAGELADALTSYFDDPWADLSDLENVSNH